MRFLLAVLAAILLTTPSVESRRHRETTTSTMAAMTTEAAETTAEAAETTTEATEVTTEATKKDKKKKHKGVAEVEDVTEMDHKAEQLTAKVKEESEASPTEMDGSLSMSMAYSTLRKGSVGNPLHDKAGKSTAPTFYPTFYPTYYPTVTPMPTTRRPTMSPTKAKRVKKGGGHGKARKYV